MVIVRLWYGMVGHGHFGRYGAQAQSRLDISGIEFWDMDLALARGHIQVRCRAGRNAVAVTVKPVFTWSPDLSANEAMKSGIRPAGSGERDCGLRRTIVCAEFQLL